MPIESNRSISVAGGKAAASDSKALAPEMAPYRLSETQPMFDSYSSAGKLIGKATASEICCLVMAGIGFNSSNVAVTIAASE